MKQLLTTLLIAILVFGCKENDGRRYFLISYAIMQDGAERIGTINSRGPTLEPREYYQNVIYNTVKCDGVSKYEIIINGVHEFKDSSEWNTWLPENSRRMPDTCPPPIKFSIEKNIGPSVMVTDSGIYMDDYTISPDPSPLPDTTKPLRKKIDSTGIVLAKALGFPEYDGQFVMLFDKNGNVVNYYDSAGWMIKDTYTNKTMPDRYSPKTIDSIVKNSQSPWRQAKPTNNPLNREMTLGLLYEYGENDIDTADWRFIGSPGTTVNINNDTTRCLLLVSDTSSINGFRSSRCWWMEGYEVAVVREFEVWVGYLDQSKIPLKKNIIVWMSKTLKQ